LVASFLVFPRVSLGLSLLLAIGFHAIYNWMLFDGGASFSLATAILTVGFAVAGFVVRRARQPTT
jgi:hypothetical protein